MINITIDEKIYSVEEETSVLEACKTAGIKIPTLCYLEKIQAIGACRVCLVEIEGVHDLVASCVMPVSEDMKIHTNNRRVREARKVVVELLLSEHEGDCQTCDRNEDCELQSIAHDLGIREIRYQGEKAPRCLDESTPALVRNSAKCIACRRCVTVCAETQSVSALFPQSRGFKTTIGPAFGKDLDTVTCVQCGQCSAVCPVGAISERDQTEEVWAALDDPEKTVVVQTAPAIRAALGECFGMEPGTLVTGKMTTALRRMEFDAVFDTNFSADLTIMEEGTELLTRLKMALVDGKQVALPMFTSCSPGWIQFMEYYYPDMLPNLSSCKSPQQMMGAMVKTYYAQKLGKKPEELFMVSVMPCTAKKFEAARAEMNSSGVQDVDVVLTTRELGKMIHEAGIDFQSLEDSEMDSPLGLGTGAADIFANTGGVMEAALRTAYEIVTGREIPFDNLHVTPVVGMDGIKEAEITIEGVLPEWSFLEGVAAKVAVAHTLANARALIERIRAGEAEYHFIEVMTCPGGCIGGGGQPRITTEEVRKARMKAIYAEDEGKTLRKSHNNPQVMKAYEDFLGEPLGHRSHELLHTKYFEKERV
ncbi:NADH-dependent [FeFe] hydrogenase, group A6 [Pontiellaceae bacterium B12227]|nr:NADH-dependent [FeFe] hydrogenase, group A6 [Pontiellaceae bacterium B12227]